MIKSIEIKGLRGIREGKLADLTPLTILVGPNGCGKSTVLEGMLIGSSPVTVEALKQVIRRHSSGGTGPNWLLWRQVEQSRSSVVTISDAPYVRRSEISIEPRPLPNHFAFRFTIHGMKGNNTNFGGVGESGTLWVVREKGKTTFPNSHVPERYPIEGVPEIYLVEAYRSGQRKLHDLFTAAKKNGHSEEVSAIVSEVFPGVKFEILAELDRPMLHLVHQNYSTPVTLAGDGIHSLARLCLELAACGRGGVALLEEPEVHQHPAAIAQSAKAIMAAVRRGIQVVLSTHSLELIDSLLDNAFDVDLNSMSLYRLSLKDGTLNCSRLDGQDISLARQQIEEDLR